METVEHRFSILSDSRKGGAYFCKENQLNFISYNYVGHRFPA